ncbi:hypothetical protein C922_05174 [Plasmodium inui San Antonio 1]|uniref:Uncharacterized protein n=1 Tax=Plasmodium inui San Antonio 1 TaxID=1237626 RepID=W6ZYR9_9APIC|nr:hypothetical protein C922_05174 [Plasmodium inui San Antonio 1]EUD64430.1 hypothetical protein C922_05174 [Plasmodium inui San Antonio 1]
MQKYLEDKEKVLGITGGDAEETTVAKVVKGLLGAGIGGGLIPFAWYIWKRIFKPSQERRQRVMGVGYVRTAEGEGSTTDVSSEEFQDPMRRSSEKIEEKQGRLRGNRGKEFPMSSVENEAIVSREVQIPLSKRISCHA